MGLFIFIFVGLFHNLWGTALFLYLVYLLLYKKDDKKNY